MIDQLLSRARGNDVLFHGTSYPTRIICDDMIKADGPTLPHICLTRQPGTAVRWAFNQRDDTSDRGAVLILDRQKLRHHFKIEPYLDEGWALPTFPDDEAEERIFGRNISNLHNYLIDIVWIPECATLLAWQDDSTRFFSIEQAAQIVGMSAVVLRRLVNLGQGPRITPETELEAPYQEFICISDLHAWTCHTMPRRAWHATPCHAHPLLGVCCCYNFAQHVSAPHFSL